MADAATPTFWSRVLAAPANRAKAKEYGFLLYAMLVSVAYAVAHDQVTATISPEYFLRWKGLAGDPMPFRWAVTALAMRASFGTGLIAGAVLLVANGPWMARQSAQLGYRELGRLSLVPLALAALFAVSWGGANSLAQIGAAGEAHGSIGARGRLEHPRPVHRPLGEPVHDESLGPSRLAEAEGGDCGQRVGQAGPHVRGYGLRVHPPVRRALEGRFQRGMQQQEEYERLQANQDPDDGPAQDASTSLPHAAQSELPMATDVALADNRSLAPYRDGRQNGPQGLGAEATRA